MCVPVAWEEVSIPEKLKKTQVIFLFSSIAIVALIVFGCRDGPIQSGKPTNASIDNGFDQILQDLAPTVVFSNTRNGVALKEALRRRQEAIAELRTNASAFLPQILEELYEVGRIAETNEAATQTRSMRLSAAFEALGDKASPLLPKLEEQFSKGRAVGPCIVAFQHIGGTKSGLILVSALTNRDEKTRNGAMSVLSSFSTNNVVAVAAVPLLIERLNDPSPFSRALAISAIGSFGIENSDITNRLLQVAKTDSDFVVRISAIAAIEMLRIKGGDVFSELQHVATSDPEPKVRQRALDAIDSLKRSEPTE